MKSNRAIIVQMRTGSTRYPGKILKKVKGRTIAELIISRLKKLDLPVTVATSDSPEDEIVCDIAGENGVDCFRGSGEDVLNRFIECAEARGINEIVRVCGDNLFIQPEFIEQIIEVANRNYFDYIGHKVMDKPAILSHLGFFAEYITLESLKRVTGLTDQKKYHEHVTNYVYNNPDKFRIKLIPVPPLLEREDIRLTLDVPEDLLVIRKVADYLESRKLDWHYRNILEYLESNMELVKLMKSNMERNVK